MSILPPFDPWGSKCEASVPETSRHTCGPRGPSCQQMTEGRDVPFSSRTAASSRRHSGDRATGSGPAPERDRVSYGGPHLYARQLSDGAVVDPGCPQQSSFSCVQQSRYQERPEVPAEPPRFPPHSHASYTSSSPLGQVSNRQYANTDQSASSKYFQIRQESAVQMLFPKPIYSYSTLIFMALMNSKTGCLPVSQIYGFMTEHFPYFKTAPDGWKNSVRHNLSLNKCFVKIENKNGNSSRKGCLWTLNPSKVEKMREELHKWRRKDPITVRRSMARPECLDRLLGERPHKFRHYSATALLSRAGPAFDPAAPPRAPCAPYAQVQAQPSCYPAPAPAHAGSPFALHSPCTQTTAVGGLNSPVAGMVPPVYGGALQAQYNVCPRDIQDFLVEGYDVDALNPSLTDLQLQGNMWEELQEDCLASDLQVCSSLLEQSIGPSCPQASAASVCQRRQDVDHNGDSAEHLEHRGCLNGPYPAAYSGVELLDGYVTTCTTSISLM